MKRRTVIILISSIIAFIIICSIIIAKNQNSVVDNKLSDLGGALSVGSNNIDYSHEITGHLNEEKIDENIVDQVPRFDKKRCWGIRRQPDNKTPIADPGANEILTKYKGKYIGDTSQKIIFLTFDEGYENGYTGQILDVLKANNVKAAFFITGPYLKEHQDLVRRMVDEGHTVGNHTIHHPSLAEIGEAQIEEEVLGLDRAFSEKFGKRMVFLRPPKGEYTEQSLNITSKLGYVNLFWSFAYDDWHRDKIRGPKYAYDIVMRNLHNGEIMLLHAVSKDNADALDMIIKGVRAQGYEFGDVESLAN